MEPRASERAWGTGQLGAVRPANCGLVACSSLVYEYKFVCTQPRPFTYLSLAAFQLQLPERVMESETKWPTKPKMLMSLWAMTKSVCQP